MNPRTLLPIAVGVACSAAFVALLISRLDMQSLGAVLAGIDAWVLCGSIAATGLGFGVATARALVLFSPHARIKPSRQLRSILLGLVGNTLLPMRLGELLRVGYLSRHGDLPPETTLATVGLERLFDLCALVAMFFGLLPWVVDLDPSSGITNTAVAIGVAMGAAVLAARRPDATVGAVRRVVAFLPNKVSTFLLARIEGAIQGLAALASPWLILAAAATTLLFWSCALMSVQCWLWAFGLELPWFAPGVVLAFLTFGTLLPAAPGYVGTYHFFVASALVLLGVDEATAISVGFVGHAVQHVPWTAISLPVVLGDLLIGWRQLAGSGDNAA